MEKSTNSENFDCSLTVQPKLDEDLWDRLASKSNRSRILKKKLNELETSEYKRLNELLDNYIKDMGWCTVNVRFTRTNDGYLLRNKCRIRVCKSYWGMKVNIFTSEAFIYCDSRCDHTI